MGRSHARIYTSIWADEDFLALSPDPQRMFLFLISQPDLEHSGVIALRERRWARGAAGLTPDDVRKALYVLGDARFVVIDEDTEELLVRSLMRWDGVWKQPNVAKAAAAQIRTVTSPALRAALLGELARLDDGDVHRDVESLRQDLIADLTAGLSKITGTPSLTPSGTPSATTPTGGIAASAEPLEGRVIAAPGGTNTPPPGPQGEAAGQAKNRTPSATPSRTPSRRVQGMGNTDVGTKAGSPTPAPVPSPSPVPAPPEALIPAPATPETANQRANRLARVYTDREKLSNFPAVAKIVRKAVDADVPDEKIAAGLLKVIADNQSLTVESLRVAIYGKPRGESTAEERARQALDAGAEAAAIINAMGES